MALVSASGIKKGFGEELLFDDVSFMIEEGDKIGFIGENGVGKSTLFKIINGSISEDGGSISFGKNTKIGYLDQYACRDSEDTVFDKVLSVYDEYILAEQELEDIRYDIENNIGDLDTLIKRQNTLNEILASGDGFYYKNRVKSCLLGLGFSEDELKKRVSELSGGQKTRVELARILLSNSNLMLLDEPTNHLDIQSVEWLEDFLSSYKGAYIVISHDRYFLDKVTNKTFELTDGTLDTYNGNYSRFVEQKEVILKTEQRKNDRLQKEISRLEGVIEQQKRWNREKNIKTAESKQKVVDKLKQELVKEHTSPENMFYKFRSCGGGGNDVLILNGIGMKFTDNRLFQNANMHITKGEKIFLLGPNGCGKTTLLKIILGIYEATEGEIRIGSNINIGYYDQLLENLSENKTIIDEVWDEYPSLTETQIRNALAVMLFRGEDVFKEIKMLSGGERARVELVKLMLKSVNFLIMDEPTNHLDIESREALEAALSGYDGTMLMVSHDRYFINKLADRIIYLDKNGTISHLGKYDDYVKKEEPREVTSKQKKINDYAERKSLEAEKRKLINDFKKTEKSIFETEEKADSLKEQLLDSAVATDYVKATELTEELSACEAELEELYLTWEELSTKIKERGIEIQ